jgi:flagellar biosynthesis protein FlhG
MSALQKNLDQAGTLRQLHPPIVTLPRTGKMMSTARVISVTSGKGGVGKTALTTNIAITLAKMKQRVLIIDADLGLANIDVIFGLTPRFNLNHYFSGEQSLASIMVTGPSGIQILPAGSGIQQLTHLTAEQKLSFMNDLDELHDNFDYVLIDTEAGISENVSYFNVAAHDILVVTTPEPTSITDAYALMKLLSMKYHQKSFQLVVNKVEHADDGLDVYQKLTVVSNRYLDIAIDYLGCIPANNKMHEAIRRQRAMVDLYPALKTSDAIVNLARALTADTKNHEPKGTMQFFWNRFFSFTQGGES